MKLTKTERTLLREQRKNSNLIARKSNEITGSLKLIAKLLADASPISYNAYRLRRSRFRLLKNNGISANMTYPQPQTDLLDMPIRAEVKSGVFNIRHFGRFQTGYVS